MFRYRSALLCILAAIALLITAFYNGYPLYDGDTHQYMRTGFESLIPPDRSPVYGFFIRITSLWTSLWLTILAQSLIVAYLLLRYIHVLHPSASRLRSASICLLPILFFTCASWFCSILNPHIFAGILLLSTMLFLFDDTASPIRKTINLIILFIAISVHNSHFLILILFSLGILVFALLKKHATLARKSVVLITLSMTFYLAMSTINYANGNGFVFSRTSQLFLVARFATNGILKRYLDDNCEKKNLKLCQCKDNLPQYPWNFMWPSPESPIARIGVWDSSTQEFKNVVTDIFTTPKYLKLYVLKAVPTTFQQFCELQISKPYIPSEAARPITYNFVGKYFDDEYNQFAVSRQNRDLMDPSIINIVYILFAVLSTIAFLFLYADPANKRIFGIYASILLFFIANAFVTSNFSVVIHSYQNRIFWILPATNMVFILKYFDDRFRRNSVTEQ